MKCPRTNFLRSMAAVSAISLFVLLPNQSEAQERPCVAVGRDVVIAANKDNRCPLIVMNGDVRLQPGSSQRGSVNVTGGDLLVEDGALVDGHVAVMDGDVEIYGTVTEQVYATGDVLLGPNSDIGGDVRAVGEIEESVGSNIDGDVQSGFASLANDGSDEGNLAARLLSGLSLIVFSIVFAALALVVASGAMGNVRDTLRGSAPTSLAVGILAAVLFPVLFLLLVPTVVGPFVLGLFYLAGAAIGTVALGEILGSRIWRSGSRIGQAALGTGILSALLALGLAFGTPLLCGFLVIVSFVAAWVLGAALLTMFGLRPWPRTPTVLRRSSGAPTTEPDLEGEALESAAPPDTGIGAAAAVATEPFAEPDSGAEPLTGAEPAVQDDSMEHTDGLATPDEPVILDPEFAVDESETAPEDEGPTPGWGWEQADGSSQDGPPDAAELPAPAPKTPTRGTELQRVPGITPIFGQLLSEAGIRTLDDLAGSTPETVAEIISVPGVLPIGRDTADTWIRQAQDLLGQ